jgi:hypothetical protein
MPDRVNATMEPMQLPAPETPLDLVRAVPERDHLPVRHHGMLPAGEIR